MAPRIVRVRRFISFSLVFFFFFSFVFFLFQTIWCSYFSSLVLFRILSSIIIISRCRRRHCLVVCCVVLCLIFDCLYSLLRVHVLLSFQFHRLFSRIFRFFFLVLIVFHNTLKERKMYFRRKKKIQTELWRTSCGSLTAKYIAFCLFCVIQFFFLHSSYSFLFILFSFLFCSSFVSLKKKSLYRFVRHFFFSSFCLFTSLHIT